jgi:hypothetical protein
MTDIQHSVIAFADRRELTVVRQLVEAVRDAVDLKAELGLPLRPETRRAVDELEEMIGSLKLQMLRRPDPNQMVLPGMDHLSSTVRHPEPDGHHGVSAVVTVLQDAGR